MSYILDALRKSDQLRQRGAAPTLMLGQAAATAPKQAATPYYVLFALVLLGAGIAIGWLRPWQPAPEPVAPAPAVIAAPAPATEQVRLPAPRPDSAAVAEPEPNTQKSARPSAQAIQPVPAPAPAAAVAQPALRSGATQERQVAPSSQAAEMPRQAVAPAQARSADSAQTGAAPHSPVIAMANLPLAIQQELPPMSISVHAYSVTAAQRLVGINNRLLREGAEVAPGLKLEQITPDGMILSYKGYSFRRGVQ